MEVLDSPVQGCLLISEPLLGDPNFEKTVIYLTAYSNLGAVGFVINKVSDMMLCDIIDDLQSSDFFIHEGGPVETDHLFFIHKRSDLVDSNYKIDDQYYWGGDAEMLFDKIRKGKILEDDVLFFKGYSGWAPGQLENELRAKSWVVVKEALDVVMQYAPEERWSSLLRKLGGRYLYWINTPANPVWN